MPPAANGSSNGANGFILEFERPLAGLTRQIGEYEADQAKTQLEAAGATIEIA